jgi:actin-related protein
LNQQAFLQPLFELHGMHDPATLLSFLNLSEKGADTMIIHPGSHSIKFGLASQMQPFIAPNVIAYPRKKDGNPLFNVDQSLIDKEIER